MLHLQDNVALARKCSICKKMLQLQENLAFSGKKMLHLQEIFLQMQHFLAIFLHLQEKFLQMQHFLATKSKIFLQLQHFIANATFSCQCNIFLTLNVKVQIQGRLLKINAKNVFNSLIYHRTLYFSISFVLRYYKDLEGKRR